MGKIAKMKRERHRERNRISLQVFERYRAKRPCGGCTACCYSVGVEALGKPANCKCQHQQETGCGIYGSHPTECKTYACFWAMGCLAEEYRPDKCGVVFTPSQQGNMAANVLTETFQDGDLIRRCAKEIKQTFPEYGNKIVLQPYDCKIGMDYDSKPPYPEAKAAKNLIIQNSNEPELVVYGGPITEEEYQQLPKLSKNGADGRSQVDD